MQAPLTITAALLRAAETERGITHVSDAGQESRQNYRQLLAEAQRVAGALRESGLRPGDRVAIIVPESENFLRAFFGASVGGFVPVPLYPPMNLGQLDSYLDHAKHIIRASESRLVIASQQVRRVLGTVQSECPSVRLVLPIEEAQNGPSLEVVSQSLDQPGFIQFTSGSTSQPKGVILTHSNLFANISSFAGREGLNALSGDVGISWLPLFHDMGLIGMLLSPIYVQLPTVIMSPLLFLKRPVEWLRAISRHKGTVSFAPNFAYGLCVKRIKDADVTGLDLSSWRVAGCGAEPIQAETLLGFARKFAPAGFREESFLPCYGMAEHTLAITFPPVGRRLVVDQVRMHDLTKDKKALPCDNVKEGTASFVGCGRPFPGHEVRVVDEHDKPVGERHVGEIVLRGPSVMKGYDRQEELTQHTLRGGWLHTGDLGYLVNGELFVCGRKKDMIIINGRNYYPQDIEWSLNDVPGVRKGNVVAFGTNAFGGQEKIVVVVESTQHEHADPLREKVAHRIREACGLMPDEIVVVPPGTLPKTSSGKLQRARTKSRYEAGALLRPPATKFKLVGQILASQLGYLKVFASRLLQKERASRREDRP